MRTVQDSEELRLALVEAAGLAERERTGRIIEFLRERQLLIPQFGGSDAERIGRMLELSVLIEILEKPEAVLKRLQDKPAPVKRPEMI
jgi:hypothetical protein